MNKKFLIILTLSTSYIDSGFGRMHPTLYKHSNSSSYDDTYNTQNYYQNDTNNYSDTSYNSTDQTSSQKHISFDYDTEDSDTDDTSTTTNQSYQLPTNFSSSKSRSKSSATKTTSKASAAISPITVSVNSQANPYSQYTLTFNEIFLVSDLQNGLELSITVFPKSTTSPNQTLYSTPSYLIVGVLKTLDGSIISKKEEHLSTSQIPTTIHVTYGSTLLTSKQFFTQNTSITNKQNQQLFNIQSPITTTMSIKNFNGTLVIS